MKEDVIVVPTAQSMLLSNVRAFITAVFEIIIFTLIIIEIFDFRFNINSFDKNFADSKPRRCNKKSSSLRL